MILIIQRFYSLRKLLFNLERREGRASFSLKPIDPVYSRSTQGIIPVTIEIRSIDVKAEVIQVGLEDNGAMEVLNKGDLVGWFNRGAKPWGNWKFCLGWSRRQSNRNGHLLQP